MEYCLTSADKVKLDAADILFIMVFSTIVILTFISSYYDKTLTKKRATPEEQKAHYKLSVEGSSEFKKGDFLHKHLMNPFCRSELSSELFLSAQLESTDYGPEDEI